MSRKSDGPPEPMVECDVCGHRVAYLHSRPLMRVTWRKTTHLGAEGEEGVTHCPGCDPSKADETETDRAGAS